MEVKVIELGEYLKERIKQHKEHMRAHVREWVNMTDHEPDTDWTACLGLVADHYGITDTPEEPLHITQPNIEDLSDVDLGAIAGLAGHAMHACGTTAPQMFELGDSSGFYVPAFIIARFIIGTPMQDVEHVVLLRLLENLSPNEAQVLVCTAQSALETLGFTADEVRTMRTVSTMDTP